MKIAPCLGPQPFRPAARIGTARPEPPQERILPLPSYVVTSEFGQRYGRMHEGIDLTTAENTPVRCVADGRVLSARWAGRLGNLVEVRHEGGWTSRYAHLNGFANLRPGQEIKMGDPVGPLGNTGLSTGPHLHFEWLDPSGRAINPRTHFNFSRYADPGGANSAA